MMKALLSAWRVLGLRLKGASIGRNVQVLGPVDIALRDGARLSNLTVGDNCVLGGWTFIRMRKNGRIVFEDSSRIATHVWLVTANDAEVRLKSHANVGSYCILNGGYGIEIGTHCLLAGFVNINSSSHKMARGTYIHEQGYIGSKVTLGDDVWLGSHVCVNQGVQIGAGAVVGAGAIVTKDIESNAIAVGNPAKTIRYRE